VRRRGRLESVGEEVGRPRSALLFLRWWLEAVLIPPPFFSSPPKERVVRFLL